MGDGERAEERVWEEGWAGHEIAQRRRLAKLPFSQKLRWLEDAQQVVLQLWKDDEFVTLLQSHGLDDGEAGQLIGRSAGAVAAVRAGLHYWHLGQPQTMLSRKMTSFLEQVGRAKYICRRCKAEI